MKLAIQEDMLPGRNLKERYQRAADLGFDGIELWADGLEERIYEVADALNQANLPVAAVNLGRRDGYLSPQMLEREQAISYLRQTMATAVDFRADAVLFVPHWGNLKTPDLTPYRSAGEISSEMMIWLIRTVSDLAYALGVVLAMQPRNRYETQFLHTVAQAYHFASQVKFSADQPNHPFVRIAPHLFDMGLEEKNLFECLNQYADRIGYLHLSDTNCGLPGQGMMDFEKLASTLHGMNYQGWLSLSAGKRGQNRPDDYSLYDALPACLTLLKNLGLR